VCLIKLIDINITLRGTNWSEMISSRRNDTERKLGGKWYVAGKKVECPLFDHIFTLC